MGQNLCVGVGDIEDELDNLASESSTVARASTFDGLSELNKQILETLDDEVKRGKLCTGVQEAPKGVGAAGADTTQLHQIATSTEDVIQIPSFPRLPGIDDKFIARLSGDPFPESTIEYHRPDNDLHKAKEADIVFLVDSSLNVGKDNFKKVIEFIYNLVDLFYTERDKLRIGMAHYATDVTNDFYLNAYANRDDVISAIAKVEYKGERRINTGTAIRYVQDNHFTTARGSRKDECIPQVLLVLTGGHSSDDSKTAALGLKANGVRIYAVGVGDIEDELDNLASESSTVARASTFDGLSELNEQILETLDDEVKRVKLCTGVQEAPKVFSFSNSSDVSLYGPVLKSSRVNCTGVGAAGADTTQLHQIATSTEDVIQIPSFPRLPGVDDKFIARLSGDPFPESTTEYHRPDNDLHKAKEADIVFLVDSSLNVGKDNFKKVIEFIYNLVDLFYTERDKLRIGMAHYATDVTNDFYLNAYANRDDVISAIAKVEYKGERRINTGTAIRYVQDNHFTTARGSRKDECIPQVLLVLTGGHSSDDSKTAALGLKANGVRIYAVGVGDIEDELDNLASESSTVARASTFDGLSELNEQILETLDDEVKRVKLCPGVQEAPKGVGAPGADTTQLHQIATSTEDVIQFPSFPRLPGVDDKFIARLSGDPFPESTTEYHRPDNDLHKAKEADIVFLVDSSLNVGKDNFKKVIEFIYNLVDLFYTERDKLRIGMAHYATDVTNDFYLNAYANRDDVISAIAKVEYKGERRINTGTAIRYVQDNHFTTARGSRKDECIPQVLLVLTGGHSSDDSKTAALGLKANGVRIYAVGVGDIEDELDNLASESSTVARASTFDGLSELNEQILETLDDEVKRVKLCPGVQEAPKGVGAPGADTTQLHQIATSTEDVIQFPSFPRLPGVDDKFIARLSGDPFPESTTEYHRPDNDLHKAKEADIVFLVDSSLNVGKDNFKKVIEFIYNLVDLFYTERDKLRIGMAHYATDVTNDFYLNAYANRDDVISAIAKVEYKGERRINTGAAIRYVQDNHFTTARGSRKDECIPQVLLVLTGGHSSDDSKTAALGLKANGVRIYAVGVGDIEDELDNLASESSTVARASTFDGLSELNEQILETLDDEMKRVKLCTGVQEAPKGVGAAGADTTQLHQIATSTEDVIQVPSFPRLPGVDDKFIARLSGDPFPESTTEYHRPDNDLHKAKEADIVFLVDSSLNVGKDNFKKVIEFIYNLVDLFYTERDKLRIGMAHYATDVTNDFYLNAYANRDDVISAIAKVEYKGERRINTGTAIRYVQGNHFTTARGSRKDECIPQVLLVLTGGHSSDDSKTAALGLKANGVRIYAVGVGDIEDELDNLASESSTVARASTFDGLSELNEQILETLDDEVKRVKLCTGVQEAPKGEGRSREERGGDERRGDERRGEKTRRGEETRGDGRRGEESRGEERRREERRGEETRGEGRSREDVMFRKRK
ncbi:Collagen alpha-3(VI) chain [Merluccius polli]|uniref:Collagen alpha-3(VI) chain n=1 Tax=Merluccius polli TaxID=89951 RepID=A0AA47NVF2_MERPO|nr:Collagen alpha-3(VI) chain [Merluccius polli]